MRDIIADRFLNGETPGHLCLIGAGMLARGLIGRGVGEPFHSTVVLTRSPKNLRKRLRSSADSDIALMRPGDIGHEREPRSIAFIATADIDDEYASILRETRQRLRRAPWWICPQSRPCRVEQYEPLTSKYVR